MKLQEYAQFDGLGLAALVKSRQVSAAELAAVASEAIDALNGRINAVIAKTPEETARALRDGPPPGPFEGVPFLVKDVGAHFANVVSEFGSRLFQGLSFPTDSELAVRFKKAGVVAVGRTNIPEFGANITSEPQLNGPTRNPWDPDHIAGGSSGGSGAAVASGMVPIAHANDGGGSIRIPAACCGVFGLKPSRNRQPWGPDADEGIFGLGCELIVSRSVRDSAAMMDATAGADIGARYLMPAPATSFLEASQRDPRRLRIAFSTAPLAGAPAVHPDCRRAVLDTARLCEALGHDVFEAAPDVTHDESCEVFSEVSSTYLAAAIDGLCALLKREIGPTSIEATSRAMLEHGRRLSAVDLTRAIGHINTVSRKLGRFFTTCDLWLSPILTTPPPRIGVFDANQEGLDARQWVRRIMDVAQFCPMFNGSGQPAMSMPLHWNDAGLPIGVQFAAHFGDESTLLALAGQLERASPWAGRTPPVSIRPAAR